MIISLVACEDNQKQTLEDGRCLESESVGLISNN